jgi:hypothetical protein
MSGPAPAGKDMRELLLLRQLRAEAAFRECQARARAVDAAKTQVITREHRIVGWRADISALSVFLAGEGLATRARTQPYSGAVREKLDDQLERDEYGLIDDQQELDEALEQMQQANAAWTKAMAKEEAVKEVIGNLKLAARIQDDRRLERQIEEQYAQTHGTRSQP